MGAFSHLCAIMELLLDAKIRITLGSQKRSSPEAYNLINAFHRAQYA